MDIKCAKCGAELRANTAGGAVVVEPCEACMTAMHECGYEAGFDEAHYIYTSDEPEAELVKAVEGETASRG